MSFDRLVALLTLVLAAAAAWAAWLPYQWQRGDRMRRRATEARLAALVGQLQERMPNPLHVGPEDAEAVALGIERGLLQTRVQLSDGRHMVQLRFQP